MRLGLKVLVGGRASHELDALEGLLKKFPGVEVDHRLLVDPYADPLAGVASDPDLLIYCVSDNWREELTLLAGRPHPDRTTMVVVGDEGDAALMRAAMRAGARDFLMRPVAHDDMAELLEQISFDKYSASPKSAAKLTAVISARGGTGNSTVAANLAHILARAFNLRTALIDLDVQFGGLPLFFDMQPSDGLLEALRRIGSLDEVAIEGYMLKHASGVHILGSAPDQFIGPCELEETDLTQLLQLLKRSYQQIVVDLPRQIDNVAGTVVTHAQRVVVVAQPNIPHIKDTRQLIETLTAMMGVNRENIVVVANRCDRNNAIGREDLEKVFARERLVCLANDFPTVSESQNLGRPLHELNARCSITRDLIALSERVTGSVLPERQAGIARRLFGLRL